MSLKLAARPSSLACMCLFPHPAASIACLDLQHLILPGDLVRHSRRRIDRSLTNGLCLMAGPYGTITQVFFSPTGEAHSANLKPQRGLTSQFADPDAKWVVPRVFFFASLFFVARVGVRLRALARDSEACVFTSAPSRLCANVCFQHFLSAPRKSGP